MFATQAVHHKGRVLVLIVFTLHAEELAIANVLDLRSFNYADEL